MTTLEAVLWFLSVVLLPALAYFAGQQRQKRLQREDWRRSDHQRLLDESARKVREFVQRVEFLLSPAGGNHGAHFETLQEAGVRELKDSEIRDAITHLALRTAISVRDEDWPQLEHVDLQKLVRAVRGKRNLSGTVLLAPIAHELRAEGVDLSRAFDVDAMKIHEGGLVMLKGEAYPVRGAITIPQMIKREKIRAGKKAWTRDLKRQIIAPCVPELTTAQIDALTDEEANEVARIAVDYPGMAAFFKKFKRPDSA